MLNTFRKLPPEKQTRILDAAAYVFAKHGYYKANVSEICRRAGISNGALYKYFKNKEDVFLSILERVEEVFRTNLEKFVPVKKSVYKVLFDILGLAIKITEKIPDYFIVYQDLGSPSMKKFSDMMTDRLEGPARDFWLYLVEEGKKRGEIDKSLDNRSAAYAIESHVTLFLFACVSPHHMRRIDGYFAMNGRQLSKEEKRKITVRALKRLLQ